MANRLSKNERAARREQITRYALLGWSCRRIGEAMDLHQSTVQKEMETLREEWRETADQNIAELKAKQLAELQSIKEKALEGWDKSVQVKTKKSREKRTSEADGETKFGRPPKITQQKQSEVIEETIGDPRFLQVYGKALEREAALLGLDAPKKIEQEGEVGIVITRTVYKLPDGTEVEF